MIIEHFSLKGKSIWVSSIYDLIFRLLIWSLKHALSFKNRRCYSNIYWYLDLSKRCGLQPEPVCSTSQQLLGNQKKAGRAGFSPARSHPINKCLDVREAADETGKCLWSLLEASGHRCWHCWSFNIVWEIVLSCSSVTSPMGHFIILDDNNGIADNCLAKNLPPSSLWFHIQGQSNDFCL